MTYANTVKLTSLLDMRPSSAVSQVFEAPLSRPHTSKRQTEQLRSIAAKHALCPSIASRKCLLRGLNVHFDAQPLTPCQRVTLLVFLQWWEERVVRPPQHLVFPDSLHGSL